jgi:hypothetical protein
MRVIWIPSLVVLLGCVSSALAALGAPTNLAATGNSATSVRLTWVDTNGNPAEDGFIIERSLSATSGFAVITTTGPNATSFIDNGLSTGTTYYYRVRAKRAQQTSAYTNVASATPRDTTAPAVPNPLVATVVSCSQINLAWGASSDGESGLGLYKIYRNNVFVRQIAAPTTVIGDTGLAASTAYTYQVSAVDNAGNESSRSMTASGITPTCATTSTTSAPTTTTTSTSRPTTSSTTSVVPTTTSTTLGDHTAPSLPGGLSATAASCSQVNLSWSGSSDTGGSGMAGYRLYRNNAFLKQVATTTTSDTGLAGSTVYGYQVSAVDNAGNESARTATSSTNTPACTSQSGQHLWSKQMGGTVLADSVVPYGVATDGAGNVFVTGVYYGTVKFGTITVASAGRGDMFVAKYSSAGTPVWVQHFGDAADQYGTAVATDASGNVYVTGYFFGTVNFGGGALTSSGYDIVLAKYRNDGVHLWSKRIGGAGTEMGQAIAVDSGNNVLIGGQYSGTVDFGGGPLTSTGGYDGFLAKYNSSGAHVWSRSMGGASVDTVTGLGVDGNGNPTVAGYFQGTSNFGGANLTSAGSNDVFVARYTSAGAHQWSNRYGDLNDQRAYGAAVDAAGNVALTGYFTGSINFGAGGPTFLNVAGADIFVAKLTSTGAHSWSKAIGSSLSYGEVGESVAFDPAGNVLLTGEVVQAVDFGGGLIIPTSVTYDAFIAKYSPAGAHLWSKRFSAAWDDHGNGVASDPSGNVLITGDFYDAVDFGGGLLSSPGGSDGFLVKLSP